MFSSSFTTTINGFKTNTNSTAANSNRGASPEVNHGGRDRKIPDENGELGGGTLTMSQCAPHREVFTERRARDVGGEDVSLRNPGRCFSRGSALEGLRSIGRDQGFSAPAAGVDPALGDDQVGPRQRPLG